MILGTKYSSFSQAVEHETTAQERVTPVFGDEPRRMFKIIRRFVKHYSCQVQGEFVMVGRSGSRM